MTVNCLVDTAESVRGLRLSTYTFPHCERLTVRNTHQTPIPMDAPLSDSSTSAPPRFQVQKTFVDARVLSGFMDDGHFRSFAGEYLASLDSAAQKEVLNLVEQSRAAAANLPVVDLGDAIARPLTGTYVDAIETNPTFQGSFRNRPHKFAWIRPETVVALQVHVKSRADPVPSGESELLQYTLPTKWDVPAEISLTPPLGPIYIMSSSPHMQGFEVQLDGAVGRVIIQPPKHINLIQVMHYSGRYYLRNGYHRLFDAVTARIAEIPALVVEALQPQDLNLPGFGAFNTGYTMGLPRPPLVSDFVGPEAIPIKMRERRYGVSIGLQVSPFNLGI